MHSRALIYASIVTSMALAPCACSNSGTSASPLPPPADGVAPLDAGPPENVYDRRRRSEIVIELRQSDWDALRHEGRSMADLVSPVIPNYEYGAFVAEVSVDGVVYEGVEVKKKGFIGSLSVLRPSLRLDFERGGVELESGLRRLTLNADSQDKSHARQCMAFSLFERAGMPAPRCSFAHVTVNGRDLGTYTNVEPIRQPMLRRHFTNAEGNLYEGTLADFEDESWQRIELETNELENDRSDLARLVDAFSVSDEALVEAISRLVDVEQFRTFWALETLLGHWDGYAEAANNYYLYHDPDTDRFVFIPWGLDQAFTGERAFGPRPYHLTVYAGARLARRLYALPEQRELFRQRLAALNDEFWDVGALLAESAAIAAVVPDADMDAREAHDDFLRAHGAELRQALLEPAPAPEALEPEPAPPPSCVASVPITGEIAGVWKEGGSFVLDLNVDGSPIRAEFSGSFDSDTTDPDDAVFSVFWPLDERRGLVLLLFTPMPLVRPGRDLFHSFETFGLLALSETSGAFTTLGLIGDGAISLREAGTDAGDVITGSLDAVLYQSVCLDPSASGAIPP